MKILKTQGTNHPKFIINIFKIFKFLFDHMKILNVLQNRPSWFYQIKNDIIEVVYNTTYQIFELYRHHSQILKLWKKGWSHLLKLLQLQWSDLEVKASQIFQHEHASTWFGLQSMLVPEILVCLLFNLGHFSKTSRQLNLCKQTMIISLSNPNLWRRIKFLHLIFAHSLYSVTVEIFKAIPMKTDWNQKK